MLLRYGDDFVLLAKGETVEQGSLIVLGNDGWLYWKNQVGGTGKIRLVTLLEGKRTQ